MEYSDEQFIQGINQKKREVFHDLYRRFYKSLIRFAMQYVSDRDVAEDIVQELFITIWERNECFLSYDRMRNFLYVSVRNTCLDLLKHRAVERKYIRYCREYSETAEREEIIAEEVFRRLFQLIDSLPLRCREIFLLHMEGKKNEEIAATLNIALDTVKNQKKKAMRILREKLGYLLYTLIFETLG